VISTRCDSIRGTKIALAAKLGEYRSPSGECHSPPRAAQAAKAADPRVLSENIILRLCRD
jgi:hypothetical protein